MHAWIRQRYAADRYSGKIETRLGTGVPETEELQLQLGIVLLQGDDLDRHSGRMEVRQVHFPKTAAADNLPDASPQLVIVNLCEHRPFLNRPQGTPLGL